MHLIKTCFPAFFFTEAAKRKAVREAEDGGTASDTAVEPTAKRYGCCLLHQFIYCSGPHLQADDVYTVLVMA